MAYVGDEVDTVVPETEQTLLGGGESRTLLGDDLLIAVEIEFLYLKAFARIGCTQ